MKLTASQSRYALKLYLSAMLAYALAASIGLLNPYWAMVTCCVLNNTVSGAIRARAAYRFCGTLFAGVLTLVLSSLLINVPHILVIISGLAASILLGLSFLDRTPKAYFFQLGALTMMLVAIAYLNRPDTMFNMVVTRVSEISIGILSVTLIDSLIFPSSLASGLRQRIQRWLPDIVRWQEECLDGKTVDQQTQQDRIKTLNDIRELTQVMSTLGYDYSVDRSTRQAAAAIQQQLLEMVPLLSSIGTTIANMPDALRSTLSPYLTIMRQHARGEREVGVTDPSAPRVNLSPWECLIVDSLERQIRQWLSLWRSVQQLNDFLAGAPLPDYLHQILRKTKPFKLPGNTNSALCMFAGILTTYTLLCLLWFTTGWEQGANMVLMGVVAIAFFGASDNPGVTIGHFARFAFIAMSLGFVLSYLLLPLASDYVSFLVVMALFLLPLGAWAAINPLATLAIALSLSNVNLQGHYNPYQLGFFLESLAATLIGIYFAFLCAALFRRWGSEPILANLTHQEQRELEHLSYHSTEKDISRYQAQALDRIISQAARLSAEGQSHQVVNLLERLNNSLYLARLRLAMSPPSDHANLPEWQSLMSSHLRVQVHDQMLYQLDSHLNTAWSQYNRQLLHLLSLLRLHHYPNAPDWTPLYDR